MARRSQTRAPDALRDALGTLAGSALVLDADLRVVAAAAGVEELLGFEVQPGMAAVPALCGAAERRPMAEALAAGRPIEVVLPQAGRRGDHRLLRLRSVLLEHGGRRTGWILFLSVAGEADAPGPVRFHGMWTDDPGMRRMFRVIERVAGSGETVLVRGETGSGKELVAHAIHELSDRAGGPFRALNCAALPPTLLESELFGHARGAFTGAVRDVPGHVQLASGGTLFLDEVAELPLELQAKLLRALETRTVIPVGGREPVAVDVRVISATHRALRREVEAGRFRADLMYRLRVIPIFIPPLRERRGDVRLLTEKIVDELNARGRRHVEQVSPATLRYLEAHDWPGNVRELRNVIAYAFAIGDGPVLAPSDLPPELTGGTPEVVVAPRELPAESSGEKARIAAVLERTAGNRNRAAQILGMSRVTLWRRMRDLGLLQG